MSLIFYKTMSGTAGAYGHGDWSLPEGGRPGRWMPKVTPVLCESGYHVCRDLSEVLVHAGPELYEVEVRGRCVEGADKAAYEQARLLRRIPEWNDETLRLFLVDCARQNANRYPRLEQRGLLHACLDVAVGYIFGFCDSYAWAAAADAAWEISAAATRDAVAATAAAAIRDAVAAAARENAWAAVAAAAAADAMRSEQIAILARYLAGQRGPFVEASDG